MVGKGKDQGHPQIGTVLHASILFFFVFSLSRRDLAMYERVMDEGNGGTRQVLGTKRQEGEVAASDMTSGRIEGILPYLIMYGLGCLNIVLCTSITHIKTSLSKSLGSRVHCFPLSSNLAWTRSDPIDRVGGRSGPCMKSLLLVTQFVCEAQEDD